jgi:hypothetical protein
MAADRYHRGQARLRGHRAGRRCLPVPHRVSYTTVTAFGDPDVTQHLGIAVPADPATAVDWSARAEGTGLQTLRWTARTGDWMVVVMNADGSPGVTVRTDVGVSAPWLAGFAVLLKQSHGITRVWPTAGFPICALILAGVIGLSQAGVTPP